MVSNPSPYDELAQAIGDVCLWWAEIEGELHDLVLHTASCLDEAFDRTGPHDVLHFTISHMDARSLITVCKTLAVHVYDEHSPTFYDRLEELLNFVDNSLRPERNRFVHDSWHHDEGAYVRSKLDPKILRPQSRKRAFSTYMTQRYSSIQEVASFVETLRLTYGDLAMLDGHVAWLTGQKKKPPEHEQPLPQEWSSIVHHTTRTPETPERQPRPFRA